MISKNSRYWARTEFSTTMLVAPRVGGKNGQVSSYPAASGTPSKGHGLVLQRGWIWALVCPPPQAPLRGDRNSPAAWLPRVSLGDSCKKRGWLLGSPASLTRSVRRMVPSPHTLLTLLRTFSGVGQTIWDMGTPGTTKHTDLGVNPNPAP